MIVDSKGRERESATVLEDERRARMAAERVSRLQDEFLATLGHELRAPLNAILGWARLLESGRLAPAEVQRGAQAIARNTRALAQLVDDIVDVGSMVGGKVRMEPEEVDLVEVVEAALEGAEAFAEAAGVRITSDLERTDCHVFGDPHRLQQVVWKLLSNGIKFTPRGGCVAVSLACSGSTCHVRVTDTGIGIPQDLLENVFDRFRPPQTPLRPEHAGLGLGLAIVKQLVELHGGSVLATSEGASQGATFDVTLPRLAPRERGVSQARGGADSSALPDLRGIRVLVVDDAEDVLELSRRVLASQHPLVAIAPSTEAALAVVEAFKPDVVVSDLAMPERDGCDLIRQIHALRGLEKLPAIALTAFVRPEDAVRAQEAGFQMHLAKPVEPDELIRVVAQAAGRG